MALTWTDLTANDPLYLNLGGRKHRHPHPQYQHYVSVDLEDSGGWSVVHDMTQPFPLPENSVDHMLTEDALHYLNPEEIGQVLTESHRLLKPGGWFRIAVPDYGNPKNRHSLADGVDERYPQHRTLPTLKSMQQLLVKSPFSKYVFYHFWDGDQFIQENIDYAKGMVQRTPDNDWRCQRRGGLKGFYQNARYRAQRGFRLTPVEKQCLRGQPLHITDLVVDCFKI